MRRTSPGTSKPQAKNRRPRRPGPGNAQEAEPTENSPEWPEVDPADAEHIREALEEAFGKVADNIESSPVRGKRTIPRIKAPLDDEEEGLYILPSSLEIRPALATPGNRFSMFLGLAIGAVLDKVLEGVHHLRDSYGGEPVVPAGHVRVRWTCVSV